MVSDFKLTLGRCLPVMLVSIFTCLWGVQTLVLLLVGWNFYNLVEMTFGVVQILFLFVGANDGGPGSFNVDVTSYDYDGKLNFRFILEIVKPENIFNNLRSAIRRGW